MFGLLYARQSCANQPPGSDAVVVLLALARPTTEWHQHIQSRRFNPCVVAQISRGLTGMGARASGFHGHGRAVFRISCGNGNAPRRLSSAPTAGPAGNGPGRGSHECEKPRVFLWGCVGLGRECFGYAKAPWGVCSEGLPVRVVRRRATLPHPVGCSTIAVPGLSFRVRNGTGRLTWAMAAANLLLYGQTLGSAGLWRPGNRTADADMSMFRLVARQCSLPSGAVCRRKMRSNRQGLECWCCLSSVSTGRLHPSRGFHVRPIDHVFCMGTTGTRRFHGMLILEQASRLDAFSGYPFRT